MSMTRRSSDATAASLTHSNDLSNPEKLQHAEQEPLPASPSAPVKAKKDAAFWMIMLALAISMFLSALDLTAVTTALPTIAHDLELEQFSWIGSSYTLSSTAMMPVFGGIANTFGRKPILIAAIVIFAVGSAVTASAQTGAAMIAGRTVQGIGGGGILTMAEVVTADIVPLSERGLFMGLLGLVWAISSCIGPIAGGALADSNWRWLFYLNLPIAAVSLVLVTFFMNLKVPAGSLKEKVKRVDWIGSGLFIVASTLLILGLTFGGDQFPWKSAGTLVPLILGIVFLPLFALVEYKWVEHRILPFELFNRTTLIGYFINFIHGIFTLSLIYYLPAWFQAVKGDSPIRAGIDVFPLAFLIAPFAIACGVTVTITQHYKTQNIVGYILATAGAGLLVILRESSPKSLALGLQVPISIGAGLLYSGTTFPVLAPLPPSMSAEAMSFHAFTRSFGQVFGITIGSTILTNQLGKKLPAQFMASLPGGAGSAFASILTIDSLPEPLRTAVRVAFSDSIRGIWIAMIGICGVGLIASLFIQQLHLADSTDENWGIERKPQAAQVESDKTQV